MAQVPSWGRMDGTGGCRLLKTASSASRAWSNCSDAYACTPGSLKLLQRSSACAASRLGRKCQPQRSRYAFWLNASDTWPCRSSSTGADGQSASISSIRADIALHAPCRSSLARRRASGTRVRKAARARWTAMRSAIDELPLGSGMLASIAGRALSGTSLPPGSNSDAVGKMSSSSSLAPLVAPSSSSSTSTLRVCPRRTSPTQATTSPPARAWSRSPSPKTRTLHLGDDGRRRRRSGPATATDAAASALTTTVPTIWPSGMKAYAPRPAVASFASSSESR
mmetsp:Transcript_8688/g.26938  ORF Transcript_8688/g.26938 Transcript_8688/m.26938 type:complete len:281 (+) Transcript_8688:782-1624(+)